MVSKKKIKNCLKMSRFVARNKSENSPNGPFKISASIATNMAGKYPDVSFIISTFGTTKSAKKIFFNSR